MTKHLSVVYIGLAMVFFQSSSLAEGLPREPTVIPKPKVETWSGTSGVVTRSGQPVGVKLAAAEVGAVAEGMPLLSRRLEILGFEMVREKNTPRIAMIQCSEESMKDRLTKSGISEGLDPLRTRQSYHLGIRKDEGGVCSVRIEAPDPLGLYYGVLTLVQLLGKDVEGNLIVPEGEILDYPEIGIRLGKTSASMSAPEDIERFAVWLRVNKIGHIGLQYHGKNSKNPEPHFPENVTRFCPEFRRKGTLESVVYFCPFRGERTGGKGAFQLNDADDCEAYVEYIRWIMDQGADGIEVDYNDWPGSREVPIAWVLNLVCDTLRESHRDAIVLYCPPARGEESYRGMATEQLGKTLSQVPVRVWPLWTGMQTLITEPLTDEQVLEWTRKAGRRPFLWVNRVGPAVQVPFVQKVEGEPGGLVFAGDFLPNDLNRLFEGVHLNAGLQSGYNKITGDFDEDALVYLATTADYLWNPHEWEPEESLYRARNFVDVMTPLIRRD
jgi:hypothetical protein